MAKSRLIPAFGDQYFCRVHPCDFCQCPMPGRAQFKASGGNINRRPCTVRPVSGSRFRQRDEPIARLAIEQRIFGQRAGGNKTNDSPRDQRFGTAAFFGLFGSFDLFGNRHTVPGPDQPGEVIFGGMHRHTAHRHGLPTLFTTRR